MGGMTLGKGAFTGKVADIRKGIYHVLFLALQNFATRVASH